MRSTIACPQQVPMLVPILGAGRHRSPKKGACFMEFASYLAGERWSDHPACTHPVLAALARDVNDLTSDAARSELVPHVHRVVGLTSDDRRLGIGLAMRAATAALPIAALERQRALAVGLVAVAETEPDAVLRDQAKQALSGAPAAERWARDFIDRTRIRGRGSARQAQAMVHTACVGIALACVEDVDVRLRELLLDAIDEAESFCVTTPERVPQPA